ncbi:hypothetical protein ASD31_10795 [Rhizobium sp. Root482]|nr:hypothetical protein ASD31_10795 [Rhizobium sp. Root482]
MSWAQELLREQDAPYAKLTELLQLDYVDYEYIVAVEGKDDIEFYSDFLEAELGANFLPFSCENKHGVLNMKEACTSYDWVIKPKFIYICDRDYDGYIGKIVDGVYYTDHYSIESEVCKGEMAGYAIRREVNPRPSSKVVAKVVSEFEVELQRCALHLKRISCLMIEIRHRNLHPDFDQCSITDFFELTQGAIDCKEIDYEAILARWGVEQPDLLEASLAWEATLLDENYRDWIRGKYLIRVARKCLEVISRKRWAEASLRCSGFLGKTAFKSVKVVFKEIPSLTENMRLHASPDVKAA